jgi:hypothetical protein
MHRSKDMAWLKPTRNTRDKFGAVESDIQGRGYCLFTGIVSCRMRRSNRVMCGTGVPCLGLVVDPNNRCGTGSQRCISSGTPDQLGYLCNKTFACPDCLGRKFRRHIGAWPVSSRSSMSCRNTATSSSESGRASPRAREPYSTTRSRRLPYISSSTLRKRVSTGPPSLTQPWSDSPHPPGPAAAAAHAAHSSPGSWCRSDCRAGPVFPSEYRRRTRRS